MPGLPLWLDIFNLLNPQTARQGGYSYQLHSMDTETWHREAQYLAQRSRDEQVAGPGVESRQFGFRIFETRQHRPPGSFRVSVGPGNPAALPRTGFCFWLGPGLPWGQRWGGLWTLCSSQILRPSHSPAQTSAGAPVVPPPDPPPQPPAGWQAGKVLLESSPSLHPVQPSPGCPLPPPPVLSRHSPSQALTLFCTIQPLPWLGAPHFPLVCGPQLICSSSVLCCPPPLQTESHLLASWGPCPLGVQDRARPLRQEGWLGPGS